MTNLLVAEGSRMNPVGASVGTIWTLAAVAMSLVHPWPETSPGRTSRLSEVRVQPSTPRAAFSGWAVLVEPRGSAIDGPATRSTVAQHLPEPLEGRLSGATTDLFKGMRYGIRHTAHFLRWSAKRWAGWLVRAFGFLVLALLAPLVDRALWTAWREKGWQGFSLSMYLGLAVYARLLLDRNAPMLGKLLVILALGYGVVSHDLLPDVSLPVGLLDDVLVVLVS
jgi:Protein of unknown function (DUF1232)